MASRTHPPESWSPGSARRSARGHTYCVHMPTCDLGTHPARRVAACAHAGPHASTRSGACARARRASSGRRSKVSARAVRAERGRGDAEEDQGDGRQHAAGHHAGRRLVGLVGALRRRERRRVRDASGGEPRAWVPGADESASTHGWAGRGAVGGWDPVALTLMRRPFADAPPPARLRARLYFVNELLDDGVHLRLEPRVGGEGVARGACARARCGDGHRQRLVQSRADRRGAIEATREKVARPAASPSVVTPRRQNCSRTKFLELFRRCQLQKIRARV